MLGSTLARPASSTHLAVVYRRERHVPGDTSFGLTARRMLRCPEAPEWGYRSVSTLSPETREPGVGTPKFAPPRGPVTKTTVRIESGPPRREVPPGPRSAGSCLCPPPPPTQALPAPPSRLGGRLVRR